jgi:hypothetical protein
MKKYAHYLFKSSIVAIVLAITLISCETGDPVGPTDARDNYLGSWFCTETPVSPSGSNVTFNVNITKDVNDTTKIKISNFSSLTGFTVATVNGNSMSIASQNVDGNTVSGSGNYSPGTDKINLSYSLNDGLTNQTYTAVYSK